MDSQKLNFGEANALLDEITDFLHSCGGVYESVTSVTQSYILFCLAVGQYILYKNDEGQIEHFICYWFVNPEDIPKIRETDEEIDKVNGSSLFIVEHGNQGGNKSLWQAVKELRRRSKGKAGLAFHHKGEELKLFPSQKGANT